MRAAPHQHPPGQHAQPSVAAQRFETIGRGRRQSVTVHVPIGTKALDEPTAIAGLAALQSADVRERNASITHCQPSPRASAAATARRTARNAQSTLPRATPCSSSSCKSRGNNWTTGACARGNKPRRDSASMRPRWPRAARDKAASTIVRPVPSNNTESSAPMLRAPRYTKGRGRSAASSDGNQRASGSAGSGCPVASTTCRHAGRGRRPT